MKKLPPMIEKLTNTAEMIVARPLEFSDTLILLHWLAPSVVKEYDQDRSQATPGRDPQLCPAPRDMQVQSNIHTEIRFLAGIRTKC